MPLDMKGRRHLNRHFSVGGSIGVFAEIYFMRFLCLKKKLNKVLKLFITIVVKQTLLTIQSRWKAIEEVSVFYSVHI